MAIAGSPGHFIFWVIFFFCCYLKLQYERAYATASSLTVRPSTTSGPSCRSYINQHFPLLNDLSLSL
ncbi:hypothetical protein ASPSYDRAFT_49084 [Aspergillus sydowii CBS 593.65]|uniref:Uncharacterized protein n=1 Tax=Aspergillus sydowii CBS 593.65 TaxID=1036612 RepID=A0A1L9T657_9EURO|nr:uncharacterized protein ASPSYDRAFT_49084 [Aspergillus sydowii CBS 593.65]OJJ54932.1 hypothetical protein ASPSYDRAFT_49084 [Aspergillus sydowii CBS 593.65]